MFSYLVPRVTTCSARLRVALIMALVLAATLPTVPVRAATTRLVTNGINDNGPNTLREQLRVAQAGDTIDFDHALAGQTISLSTGPLIVGVSVTIQNTSGGTIAIDGNANSRVFNVAAGTVTIRDLTIQHGFSRDGLGGGIRVEQAATLTLERVVVRENMGAAPDGSDSAGVNTSGGMGAFGGGISNVGTLSVRNSTILGNIAQGGRGGSGMLVPADGLVHQAGAGGGGGFGGGLYTDGTATIIGSTFSGNRAIGGAGGSGVDGGGGGAGIGGAIFQNTGTLRVTNVTMNGNSVQGSPGGDYLGAGFAIGVGQAHATIGWGGDGGSTGGRGGFGAGGGGAATLGPGGFGGYGAGGGASDGGGAPGGVGGGFGGGAFERFVGGRGGGIGAGLFVLRGTAAVASSTITANTATGSTGGLSNTNGTGIGGGIAFYGLVGGSVALRSTIVAGNTAATHPDVDGAISSQGYNLVQNPDGATGLIGTDKLNADPRLGQLQINAPGLTATRALQTDSPALDAGPPDGCLDADGTTPLTTDQRGAPRAFDGDANGSVRCDIGAYELVGARLTPTASALTITEGDPARPVDPGLTIADDGSPAPSGATVQITGGYADGQDLLELPAQPGLTATFDAAHGLLALRGRSTLAVYQTALRAVTYRNTAHPPSTAPRTISFVVQTDTLASIPVSRMVNVVNLPPVAAADTYAASAGAVLTVPAPGVLANDSDVAGTNLSAIVAAGPQHGTLTLDLKGGFTYTAGSGFAGTDTFTYRASDGSAQSQPATVTITVPVVASACTPRPRVATATAAGGGKLAVHVEATALGTQQPNQLKELRFGALQNARVTFNGQLIASGQTVTILTNSASIDFTVERATPGQATTVPLTVVDGCGAWSTFVGGGTGAAF